MWRLALSVAAGVVHGFSMAWPASVLGSGLGVAGVSSGFLQCASLGVLAALLLSRANQEAHAWRQGALLSALFACSAMVATWGWLYVSMQRYGVLAVRLGGAAFGSGAVALFCGSWCGVGGLVQALDVVCALE